MITLGAAPHSARTRATKPNAKGKDRDAAVGTIKAPHATHLVELALLDDGASEAAWQRGGQF